LNHNRFIRFNIFPDRHLEEEGWADLAAKGFDQPRHFAAFLHTSVELRDAEAAYFKKCEEKLGFVPQCAQGLRAFDNAKLSAFVPKETAPVVGDFVARRHAPGG
jgi:hypothetical protein